MVFQSMNFEAIRKSCSLTLQNRAPSGTARLRESSYGFFGKPVIWKKSMPVTKNHESDSSRVPNRTTVWLLPVLVVSLMSSNGCMNPDFVRYPTWNTSFPAAENAAYGRQDPFPDPDIGPSTDSSPRGYERPRSTARQAAEQRLLQGLPVGPESVPAGAPQGSRNNNQAVY